MKILVYWHDIFLPHSAYIIQSLDDYKSFSEIILLGPEHTAAEEIFNQPDKEVSIKTKKTKFVKVKTYGFRKKWCKFSEYVKYIRQHQPHLIIVLDEALSLNVLLAGLANKLLSTNAKVVFYGFDNLYTGIPIKYFLDSPSFSRLWVMLRKTTRFLLLDKLLMPLRKKIIYGGLTSYKECTELIHQYNWYPKMKEQWWPINLKVFFSKDSTHLKKEIDTRMLKHIGNGKKFLGYVGRFIPEKGLNTLLQAFATLDDSYVLLLIGSGEYQNEINKIISHENLTNRVIIIPAQNQSTLAAYYRIMNLLILPSITDYFWKEQYGRVLVEAMASETLVLGSSSGAIPYVIGNDNFIFQENNAYDLSQKIEEICLLPDQVKQKYIKENLLKAKEAEPAKFIDKFILL